MDIETMIAVHVIDYIQEVCQTHEVNINKVAGIINARLATAKEPELHVDGVAMGKVMCEQIQGVDQ